jgi:hypothetical protein
VPRRAAGVRSPRPGLPRARPRIGQAQTSEPRRACPGYCSQPSTGFHAPQSQRRGKSDASNRPMRRFTGHLPGDRRSRALRRPSPSPIPGSRSIHTMLGARGYSIAPHADQTGLVHASRPNLDGSIPGHNGKKLTSRVRCRSPPPRSRQSLIALAAPDPSHAPHLGRTSRAGSAIRRIFHDQGAARLLPGRFVRGRLPCIVGRTHHP